MDQLTHDVRSCHERPAGQSAKKWLDENGIDEKQYYYWQRRIRNLVAETTSKSLPATRPTGEVTFVEMPSPIERQVECPDKAVASSGPAALIRTSKLEIELSNDISDELLSKILKVTAYARKRAIIMVA